VRPGPSRFSGATQKHKMCHGSCGNICEQCAKRGHTELTVLRSALVGTDTSPTAVSSMKSVAPHSAVLVCRSVNARSIQKYLSDGISKHIGDLKDAEAARASRLPDGSVGPFAMVGPQATDEQQRISQKGLLAAIEADAEASADLL